jgi:ABC-2 type transport system ATP-binding protein
MIKLVNVTKWYRGFRAVDSIDLSIEKGAIFGFLGPNGAGKTTTIKMMAGILEPTEGRIIIKGMDLFREPSKAKRCIGFIPDRPFLYEKLTGSEFLQFMARLYRLNGECSSGRRANSLLELFELEDWADELIESYSHGMKQRLVMCAALLHKPDVIIVDEPMVGLDPKAARLVKDVFRDQALGGATIFMSTHSLEVAEEVCSRIAIIQEGRIIATGTAEELRHQAGVDGSLENIFLTLTEGSALAHDRTRFAS